MTSPTSKFSENPSRFEAAILRFDEENSRDPNSEEVKESASRVSWSMPDG